MTDDDIRDMLRTRAEEATVSPDAWDKIAARLHDVDTPVRRLPRRLAIAGVAAAAIAGTVVVANLPASNVATTTTTTTAVRVDMDAIHDAATAWLDSRLSKGVDRGKTTTTVASDGTSAHVTYDGGSLATELSLVPNRRGGGWRVVSAASDLVLIDNPTYDGRDIAAEAVPAVVGEMTTTFVVNGGQTFSGGRHAVSHEAQTLGLPVVGAFSAAIRVVLVTEDGTTALSEVPAAILRDPATVEGSYVAVSPATDAAGLASLQQQADSGRRPDLLDPQAVAGNYLYEQLPKAETTTSYRLGDFRQADPTSGEVPYTLSDGSSGEVLLRRTADDDKRIWYVTGATSEVLQVAKVRHEGSTTIADVFTRKAGTLVWPGGDAPIEVLPGQTVSISRTDDPKAGSYPITLRLMDGKKTLAVFAQVG